MYQQKLLQAVLCLPDKALSPPAYSLGHPSSASLMQVSLYMILKQLFKGFNISLVVIIRNISTCTLIAKRENSLINQCVQHTANLYDIQTYFVDLNPWKNAKTLNWRSFSCCVNCAMLWVCCRAVQHCSWWRCCFTTAWSRPVALMKGNGIAVF